MPATVLLVEWHFGRFVWLRCQRYSEKLQGVVAIGLFAGQLVWTIVAFVCGFKLAHLVIMFSK